MIEPEITFEIPDSTMTELQSIVDTMAELVGVPAGLIMRVVEEEIEVFISSQSDGNPYKVGDREHLWKSGLYCEHVIRTKSSLLVPNALKDDEWKDNPDVKLNMISYLGFPVCLPDGRVFGTICVLDSRENGFSELQKALVSKFRDLSEHYIGLVYANSLLQEENRRLIDLVREIRALRRFLPVCSYCKKIKDQDDRWHPFESYLDNEMEVTFSHGICPECFEELEID